MFTKTDISNNVFSNFLYWNDSDQRQWNDSDQTYFYYNSILSLKNAYTYAQSEK